MNGENCVTSVTNHLVDKLVRSYLQPSSKRVEKRCEILINNELDGLQNVSTIYLVHEISSTNVDYLQQFSNMTGYKKSLERLSLWVVKMTLKHLSFLV